MDKNNEFYREIKVSDKVTRAESTIAWFYSGRKQPLIDVVTRFPVYADGIYDCTKKLQAAFDIAGGIPSLPSGEFKITAALTI